MSTSLQVRAVSEGEMTGQNNHNGCLIKSPVKYWHNNKSQVEEGARQRPLTQ